VICPRATTENGRKISAEAASAQAIDEQIADVARAATTMKMPRMIAARTARRATPGKAAVMSLIAPR
jgi:hypothetical protein